MVKMQETSETQVQLPGLGRSLEEGRKHPLQNFCLENFMDEDSMQHNQRLQKTDNTKGLKNMHTY